jgi:ubiquinone/menaquinone biosynthesis C-methylase UbiE
MNSVGQGNQQQHRMPILGMTACAGSGLEGRIPMPFPLHDRFWTDTVQFLKPHHRAGQPMLAPDEFVDQFPTTQSYAASFAAESVTYPWVVLHKGLLHAVAHRFLMQADRSLVPVFANEVFVVLTDSPDLPSISNSSAHYQAYKNLLVQHQEQQPSPFAIAESLHPRPDIATLTVEQVRQEMNKRYSQAATEDEFCGYEHPHLWDRVRFAELDRLIQQFAGDVGGQSLLDLACGMGRNVPLLPPCREYIGIDLSDVAIARAQKRHQTVTYVRFQRMDCMNLDFPAQRFDTVLAIEMIEHVHQPHRVLSEAGRVLKPHGRLLINSANRDSLHLRMTRSLGLPEFRATKEHMREFSYAEMAAMLDQAGFSIEDSAGVFLLPYYGIPELDRIVCKLTHDDPAVVEMFRDLGQRAGPEYGFEFIVVARKR